MMAAFQELSPQIGVASTCGALQINRMRVYRQRARLLNAWRPGPMRRRPRPRPPLSQTPAEQELLLSLCHARRNVQATAMNWLNDERMLSVIVLTNNVGTLPVQWVKAVVNDDRLCVILGSM